MSSFLSVDDLDIYLIQNAPSLPELQINILESLILDRKWNFVLQCLQKEFPLTKEIKKKCVESGYLPLYQYLYPDRIKISTKLLQYFAQCGYLDVLQWGISTSEEKYYQSLPKISHFAACYGHISIIQWLHSIDKEICETATKYSISGGHLNVAQWFYNHGYSFIPEICDVAAKYGHFEILKWIHSIGYPLTENTCILAAKEGHLNILKWLHEKGIKWNLEKISKCAIRGGKIEMMEWLNELNCPISRNIGVIAAKYERWDIIKWAYFRKYAIRDVHQIIRYVIKAGNMEMLKWLFNIGCLKVFSKSSFYNKSSPTFFAVQYCQLEMLKWMIEYGIPYDLKFLKKHNFPMLNKKQKREFKRKSISKYLQKLSNDR